jgi:amidohydrolase
MEEIKARIDQEVTLLAEDLFAVSDYLMANPELAYKEFKACSYLSDFLRKRGFQVEQGVGGLETSFVARPTDRLPKRPTVAFLAEYDALVKIGHGCGHNLIAAASLGAAISLSNTLGEIDGGFAVVGTPAEEGGGGKVRLAEAGVFDEMDAAMMFHPGRLNTPGKDSLGRIKFKMEFFGKAAHASGSPDQGINALEALVITFNSINALRQHLHKDARVHGIITHGGDAPNIIPDYAAGLFYVRAGDQAYRDDLFDRVKNCAQGAAMAVGAELKIEVDQPVLDPIKRNIPLEEAFGANMKALGISIDVDDGTLGSSDIGNLSQYLPAIHPFLAIVGPDIPSHSEAFAEATASSRGRETMITAAKMLARTAYDYLTSAELRDRVSKAFGGGEF